MAVVLLLCAGSSRKDTLAVATAVSDDCQSRNRDNVIANWQDRIVESARCSTFKYDKEAEGKKFSSTATGGFVVGMQRLTDTAKSSGRRKSPVGWAASGGGRYPTPAYPLDRLGYHNSYYAEKLMIISEFQLRS